jgi:DNA-binding beta-propeller fold protein YncE
MTFELRGSFAMVGIGEGRGQDVNGKEDRAGSVGRSVAMNDRRPRLRVPTLALSALALTSLAAGCGGTPAEAARAPARAATEAPLARPAPLDESRAGSTVVLARLDGRTVAYVADEDERAVFAVDVDTRDELSRTPLDGAPAQLLVTKSGRVVVSLRDRSALAILEPSAGAPAALAVARLVATPAEPIGLAATPDDATILVASGWGARLSGYDERSLARVLDVPLAREPRAIVVSDDGARAFVSHAVGSLLTAVELRAPAHAAEAIELVSVGRDRGLLERALGAGSVERQACQGFSLAKSVGVKGRVFAPHVLVDPGDPRFPSEGYGQGGERPPEVADVAVIDEDTRRPLAASLLVGVDVRGPRPGAGDRATGECLLPRAAAIDGASGALLVACLGLDALIEYDARSAEPHAAERRRFPVGAGPTGVAVDGPARRAIVWSQFDRVLAAIPLDGDPPAPPARVALSSGSRGLSGVDVALGRRLFHATTDARISSDGRACASCHPDGRDDALTWATPDGPRQTIMLAGRVDATAPYGWSGSGADVPTHLGHTFQRLGGAGLTGGELDALVAYLRQMAPPAETATAARELVARGEALFRSEAGCATCHEGGRTDGARHDVKSRTDADHDDAFDTPSLRFVSGTAPYFHDGRYPTLRALLADPQSGMGRSSDLSTAELDALEAYLRSL